MSIGDYDKQYPIIPQGEFVVVSPLKFKRQEYDLGYASNEGTDDSGLGQVLKGGKVIYTIRMIETGRIIVVPRTRITIAKAEDLLNL